MSESLGDRIRKIRIDKGLQQKDLTAATGYSQKYLSEIERNKVEPRIGVAIKLARVLNVSLDYLLLGNQSEQPTIVQNDLYQMPISESRLLHICSLIKKILDLVEKEVATPSKKH